MFKRMTDSTAEFINEVRGEFRRISLPEKRGDDRISDGSDCLLRRRVPIYLGRGFVSGLVRRQDHLMI